MTFIPNEYVFQVCFYFDDVNAVVMIYSYEVRIFFPFTLDVL